MRWHSLLVPVVAAVAMLAGCGTDHGTNPAPGLVRVSMTDAPGAYDQVNVVVREVRVHAAGETDDGWYTVRTDADTTIDLLTLANGGFVTLGDELVPAGDYDQVRLVLGDGSTVVVDGVTHALTVPSGMQSGIKVQGLFTVPPGGTVDVALDFDAGRSIHETGNGKWMMRPVIRLVVLTRSGAIAGQLDPATDATVYAITGADTVASTVPATDGTFKLAALPGGTYDVAIDVVAGYRDTTLTGVGVAPGDTTQLGVITLTPQ